MIKKTIWFLIIFMVMSSVDWATDLKLFSITCTVDSADSDTWQAAGSRADTGISDTIDVQDWQVIAFDWELSGVDTAFTADSIYFLLQTARRPTGPFYTIARDSMTFTSVNDTAKQSGWVLFKVDSIAILNFLRVLAIHSVPMPLVDSVLAGDTASLTNPSYELDLIVWVNKKE